jgi:hypothetical protein
MPRKTRKQLLDTNNRTSFQKMIFEEKLKLMATFEGAKLALEGKKGERKLQRQAKRRANERLSRICNLGSPAMGRA